jgi:hypothetical protein
MFDSEKKLKSRAGSYFDPKLIKNWDWNSLISKFKKKTQLKVIKKSNNNLKLVHSSLLAKTIEMRNIPWCFTKNELMFIS